MQFRSKLFLVCFLILTFLPSSSEILFHSTSLSMHWTFWNCQCLALGQVQNMQCVHNTDNRAEFRKGLLIEAWTSRDQWPVQNTTRLCFHSSWVGLCLQTFACWLRGSLSCQLQDVSRCLSLFAQSNTISCLSRIECTWGQWNLGCMLVHLWGFLRPAWGRSTAALLQGLVCPSSLGAGFLDHIELVLRI